MATGCPTFILIGKLLNESFITGNRAFIRTAVKLCGAVSQHQGLGEMLIPKSLFLEICLVFLGFGNEPFLKKTMISNYMRKPEAEMSH